MEECFDRREIGLLFFSGFRRSGDKVRVSVPYGFISRFSHPPVNSPGDGGDSIGEEWEIARNEQDRPRKSHKATFAEKWRRKLSVLPIGTTKKLNVITTCAQIAIAGG